MRKNQRNGVKNPWKTKKSVQNAIKNFLLTVFGNPKVHLMDIKDIAKSA
jgi:O-acetylhomoserine/O-acetylserine sulfhydrylase-like pyridoxal-dependent enzyme